MPAGPADVVITPVATDDAMDWEQMREALWPSAPGEHASEIADWFAGRLAGLDTVLIARNTSGEALGFIELAIRTVAESCYSGRIGYVEGWYVESYWRRRGVGLALLRAAEDWARAQGCSEMASDAALDNRVSQRAHEAAGFAEVGRSVCYRKALDEAIR